MSDITLCTVAIMGKPHICRALRPNGGINIAHTGVELVGVPARIILFVQNPRQRLLGRVRQRAASLGDRCHDEQLRCWRSAQPQIDWLPRAAPCTNVHIGGNSQLHALRVREQVDSGTRVTASSCVAGDAPSLRNACTFRQLPALACMMHISICMALWGDGQA